MLVPPIAVFKFPQVSVGGSAVYTQRNLTPSLKLLVDMGSLSFELLARGGSHAVYGRCGAKVAHTITVATTPAGNIEVTFVNQSTAPQDISITPINDSVPIIEASW